MKSVFLKPLLLIIKSLISGKEVPMLTIALSHCLLNLVVDIVDLDAALYPLIVQAYSFKR
jgi:hypothetical protein